jgi:hypothetical protein
MEPSGWQPVMWSGYAAFSRSGDMSRTGNYSGKISATSTASAAFLTNSSNRYVVVSGETYAASAWVTVANISNGEGAVISIAWFDSDGSYITTTVGSSLSNASSWTKIRVSGQAPLGASSAQLELHLSGNGLVWYDDVSFSRVITEYGGSGSWSASRQGLDKARLTANADSLTLEGTFAYQSDERLTYSMSLVSPSITTEDYAWLEISYKTSAPNAGGLSLALNYKDGTQIPIYGITFSEDWKTTYIDVRKTPNYLSEFNDRSEATPGKPVESIEITLDDKPDTISDGTYSISIRNMAFYRYTNTDMFLAILSAVLVLLILIVAMGQTKIHPSWSLAIAGGIVSFVASVYRTVLPFLPLVCNAIDIPVILQLVSCLVIFAALVKKLRAKSEVFDEQGIDYSKNNKKVIGLLLGLLLIPFVGSLLRFNNALTVPLFDDELSHAVTSWGLLHGRFVGLNLAGPWDPVTTNLLKTGVFRVEPWPSSLSMPFVGTLIYPSFTVVSPFIEPFVAYLYAGPFLQILGFNEIGIRLPFITMNILIIMLIYIIGSRNGNILAGLLGSLFFAVNPYSSHYGSKAFLDNAVGLFFLLSFYFFLKYRDKLSNPSASKYLYLSAVFAAISALSKIGAVFAPAFLVVALLTLRKMKRTYLLKALVLMIGIISVYPVIGLLTSPKAFLLSMSGFFSYAQTAATVESSGALPVFGQMVLIGAALIGLLCLIYLISIREKDSFYLILATIMYILILLFVFTYAKEHYFVALMPFLSIAVGITLTNIACNVKPVEIMLFYSIFTLVLATSLSYNLYLLAILIFLNAVYLYNKANNVKNTNTLKQAILYFSLLYILLLFSILMYDAWRYVFLY